MAAISREHDIRELLRRARDHLRTSRHAHAEALAEVVLAWDAGSDEAMEILAKTALQRQDNSRASVFLGSAIKIHDTAERQAMLARSLVALERRSDALIAFRRAAELAPDDGVIANDLGVALAQSGNVSEAELAFCRAVKLLPEMAEARGNLATALRQLGRTDDAAALTPPIAPVESATPDLAELHRERAVQLQRDGRLAEAEAELHSALAIQPEAPDFHADLGWVVRRRGRLDEATAMLTSALERWPDEPRIMNSLAIALLEAGQLDKALGLLERAAALAPTDAEAQHNRAMLLLRMGRYREGWEAYEWRWQTAQGRSVHRAFSQEIWSNQSLEGRTILLHAEQGLGDTLQFLRYVPLVAARGAKVVLEVPATLGRLAEDLPGVAEVVWAGDPLPVFDLHCPLLSLPRTFRTTLESIPPSPYLRARDPDVAVWRQRLTRDAGLRVGLVWAGRPEHRDDARRSMPFAALQPLWRLPAIRWVSLQMGVRADELTGAPAGTVVSLGPLLADFADTAAALSALDLLVTVDTATAHLAGALGHPAWVLLAQAADWRWMHGRDGTPWYPSLRLFRQTVANDWKGLIDRLVEALTELSQSGMLRP